jgi:hypothetical protein
MPLTRLQQLFIAEETTESTGVSAGSLYTSANSNYLPLDLSLEYDVPLFERNVRRASLTPLQGLTGIQQGTAKFQIEMTGTSAIGTAPPFGLPLRACGFRQETLVRIAIGAVTSGPFRHGETVTQATSGATATVVQDCYTGQTDLWVTQANGLGNTTAITQTAALVWTGATSGATATQVNSASNPFPNAGICL